MHELGVLRQIIKTVNNVAKENRIKKIKHITIEVGEISGVVPYYLKKLYPVAIDAFPMLKKAELRIQMIDGSGLIIKEIGY